MKRKDKVSYKYAHQNIEQSTEDYIKLQKCKFS